MSVKEANGKFHKKRVGYQGRMDNLLSKGDFIGNRDANRVDVNQGIILKIFFLVILFLICLSLLGAFMRFQLDIDAPLVISFYNRFNLNGEGNIPAFFSSFILFFSACLFYLIAQGKKRLKSSDVLYWKVLGGVFLYLSMDEAFILHEIVGNQLTARMQFSGFLYFPWVIAGAALVTVFAALYLKFFLALPPETRKGYFLAGFVFVAGALGMEMIGGYFAQKIGEENFSYQLLVALEESLEMFGILILLKVLFTSLKEDSNFIAIYWK